MAIPYQQNALSLQQYVVTDVSLEQERRHMHRERLHEAEEPAKQGAQQSLVRDGPDHTATAEGIETACTNCRKKSTVQKIALKTEALSDC